MGQGQEEEFGWNLYHSKTTLLMALFVRVKVLVLPLLGQKAAPLPASLPRTQCCAGSHTQQELVLPQGHHTHVGESVELGMSIGKVGKTTSYRQGANPEPMEHQPISEWQVTD